jgi:hypothetical protein
VVVREDTVDRAVHIAAVIFMRCLPEMLCTLEPYVNDAVAAHAVAPARDRLVAMPPREFQQLFLVPLFDGVHPPITALLLGAGLALGAVLVAVAHAIQPLGDQ